MFCLKLIFIFLAEYVFLEKIKVNLTTYLILLIKIDSLFFIKAYHKIYPLNKNKILMLKKNVLFFYIKLYY